jgi:hypothetical protein
MPTLGTDKKKKKQKQEGLLLVVAHHIMLTPANQLLVMGQIIWSLTNPRLETATFQSLA